MQNNFDYREAFSRNIGWVTENEQAILGHKRIAIAGMGGVGGSHLLTLTRLGIGAFNIADYDDFELANFNRQAGATLSHVGKPKVDILADMALDINPELDIKRFPAGVTRNNLATFFSNVDVYVDGLDFFAFDSRGDVFEYCRNQGIPAITAAPLGMGTALLCFMPGRMSFEEYFRLAGQTENEKGLRFLLGLAPAGLHGDYLVDPRTIDLKNQKGPSTPMGCELCAGTAATQALKILLGRGKVWPAPNAIQFDSYRNKLVRTWRPAGNNHPLQKLSLSIARRHFLSAETPPRKSSDMTKNTVIERIIDVARWAPSGDNTQPWRFEIKGENHLVIHGHDTREHCVYDLHGHPSQLAIGALLQCIEIAATQHSREINITRRSGTDETKPTFDVLLEKNEAVKSNPLFPFIPQRTVQRRSMQRRQLTKKEKLQLEEAVSPNYRVLWIDGWKNKLKTALLMFSNAKIRLTMPEAYQVHKSVIEWRTRYSKDKIPDQAVGLDPVATRIMEWTMKSWSRVKFFNTFMAGTLLPRIELDLIPGINCGAHFVLIAEQTPVTIDDYVEAGRALQRFWLTGTKLGLQLQPEMTPLIFSSYIRDGIDFTKDENIVRQTHQLSIDLQRLIGEQPSQNSVFMGRIGEGLLAKSRSIRQSVEKLMLSH